MHLLINLSRTQERERAYANSPAKITPTPLTGDALDSHFLTTPLFLHVLRREDEREGDDDGRRAGVCDPADDHRKAVVRPGREDDWAARGMVLRPPVYRQ